MKAISDSQLNMFGLWPILKGRGWGRLTQC